MPSSRTSDAQVSHGWGEEPLYMATRLYVGFLKNLFAQFPEPLWWNADEEQTRVIITDQSPVDQEALEKRPHIVTIRGPAQYTNLSMDQFREMKLSTSGRTHTDLIQCTMSIHCISKEGVEAQRFAWTVMWALRRYRRLLMTGTQIHQVGNQLSMSSETPPGTLVEGDPRPGVVMVSVTSPFYLQDTWFIENIGDAVLTEIDASLRIAEPTTERFNLRGPTIRGRPLQGLSIGRKVPNP